MINNYIDAYDDTNNSDYQTSIQNHQPVTFETDFQGLPLRGKDIDDIFHQYNEYSKDQGFKMTKSIKKSKNDSMIEYASFTCTYGHSKALKQGYKKTKWKNDIHKSKNQNPCRARVVFEKVYQSEWNLKEIVSGHTHDPDPTMLSNEIIYYIDEYVTSVGCKITPIDMANHLRAKFKRDFDLPSLFHHLGQRFDIHHKSDNVEFVKDYIASFGADIKDHMYDELQVHKFILLSNDMMNRYQQYGQYIMFIDTLFSFKFISNYFLLLTGINPNGEIQIFGVIITSKDVNMLKSALMAFQKLNNYKQPQTLIVDADPYILEACQQTFNSTIQLSQFHIYLRTKKLFKNTEVYQKAIDLVSTDLFIKEYLDLTQGKTADGKLLLNFDQHNFLYFLHQNKALWQGLYIETSLINYGVNNSQRFLKSDYYFKLNKMLNQKTVKISAKSFNQTLEQFQGSQPGLIYQKYSQKIWYRQYLTFITIPQSAIIPQQLLQILNIIKDSKLAIIYLMNEYNESQRWKILSNENGIYSLHLPRQFLITSSKAIRGTLEFSIDQIKQREWTTIKHKLMYDQDEDIESVSIEQGIIKCSCEYEKEFGGLPCRHKFRVICEMKISFEGLLCNLDRFWILNITSNNLNSDNQNIQNIQLNPEIK